MNKEIIVIDLDSTIIHTSKTIINLYNKQYDNNKIDYINNHNWKFYPMVKTDKELSQLLRLFNYKDFYKDVIVFPNAINTINKLAKDFHIVICTKHMESRKPLTTKWVDKTFGDNVELVFAEDFYKKGAMFPKALVVIDDRIDSLNSFSNNTLKICYGNYEWNKEWKCSDDCDRIIEWNYGNILYKINRFRLERLLKMDNMTNNVINTEEMLDELSIKYMVGTIKPKEEKILERLIVWYMDDLDEEEY